MCFLGTAILEPLEPGQTLQAFRLHRRAAPIARIKGVYRFRLILKGASRKALSAVLKGMLAHADEAGVPRRSLTVDVDALRLM